MKKKVIFFWIINLFFLSIFNIVNCDKNKNFKKNIISEKIKKNSNIKKSKILTINDEKKTKELINNNENKIKESTLINENKKNNKENNNENQKENIGNIYNSTLSNSFIDENSNYLKNNNKLNFNIEINNNNGNDLTNYNYNYNNEKLSLYSENNEENDNENILYELFNNNYFYYTLYGIATISGLLISWYGGEKIFNFIKNKKINKNIIESTNIEIIHNYNNDNNDNNNDNDNNKLLKSENFSLFWICSKNINMLLLKLKKFITDTNYNFIDFGKLIDDYMQYINKKK